MNPTPDNPPAFPVPDSAHMNRYGFNGMTLRDYFAAQALPAVMVRHSDYIEEQVKLGGSGSVNDIAATISYAYADAMLKARAGK